MNRISKIDKFTWTMSFVGTGIGAGILFLPLQAGVGGVFCFLISAVVAFFFSIISHRIFAKLTIDSEEPRDYSMIVKRCLGRNYSIIVTVFFLILTLGYLAVYIIGLNVGLGHFLETCGASDGLEKSFWFIISIVAVLILIVSANPRLIVKIMGIVTFPLIVMLTCLSLYLIRYWDLSYITTIPETKVFITGFLFNIPLLIFAVMFFPPITSMVRTYRSKLRSMEHVSGECYKTLIYTQFVLLGFITFFTVSSLLASSPEALNEGMLKNLSIMNVLANIHHEPILRYVGPVIAICAILTSFLGYYFGAKECARNLIRSFLILRMGKEKTLECNQIVNSQKVLFVINISLGVFLVFVAVMNFNVEAVLGMLCGPIIALILYITPFLVLSTTPLYKRYRGIYYWSLLVGGILIVAAYPLGSLLVKYL
jgi:serine transporter